MKARTISHVQGKGSIAHNNRIFSPKNADRGRTPDNVCYISKPIAEAYSEIFDEAVESYNANQKRADRMIKTGYFEHLFNHAPSSAVIEAPNGQKSFYEDVVQIGTMHDTGIGSEAAELAKSCLDEYMKGFQQRNPNFIVFNAVLHMDEATPHLHIDYIPIGHYTRGVPIQNGIAQALKEMGYGGGKDAINRWRLAERNVLKAICISRGIEVAEEKEGRGYSMKCDEYKEHEDKIHAYEEQEKALVEEIKALTEAKAAAEDVTLIGKKVPVGNARLVSENEFEAITAQKKFLAAEGENVKAKNAHLDRERFYNDMKEKKLNEKEEHLDKREKALDEREEDIRKKEKSADEKKSRADKLYSKQKNLNEENETLTEDNEKLKIRLWDYNNMRTELYEAKEHLREVETKNKRDREKELEEISLEHKRELREKDEKIKSLSSDYENAAQELETAKSENEGLKEKIKSLVQKNEYLHSFIQVLYDVGRYFGKKLGFDFDYVADKHDDGYDVDYLVGDRRSSMER